jgi:hypothetical protein
MFRLTAIEDIPVEGPAPVKQIPKNGKVGDKITRGIVKP